MSIGMLIWFIGLAIVLYTIDRIVAKWLKLKMKDCNEVYSETGVEDDSNGSNDSNDNNKEKG